MKSKRLIVATSNRGKLKEFAAMLEPLGFELASLADYPELAEVVEDGASFAANAQKKAEEISKQLQLPVLADDSGLVVDALAGAPGIYSARYAGDPRSDSRNIEKLLNDLKLVPPAKRAARFVAALALAIPGQETLIVEGTCEGVIATAPAGSEGFGYDPVFYLPERKQMMAELTADEKNKISHRANALQKLTSLLVENSFADFR